MSNISVMCGEIETDGGFEFKLPSDSLNQTLNPDCEQSWYLQSHLSREIMFRVRNETAVIPNSALASHLHGYKALESQSHSKLIGFWMNAIVLLALHLLWQRIRLSSIISGTLVSHTRSRKLSDSRGVARRTADDKEVAGYHGTMTEQLALPLKRHIVSS
ncbi:hypothetical protein QQF64_025958 [Cirrhinus molitorella]|uniref:Uncharacterized protein n=1 Tax=Cirrhinus molitorella TaxID=172907 RepID=A0ABR3NQF9_9TELE